MDAEEVLELLDEVPVELIGWLWGKVWDAGCWVFGRLSARGR